jgi:opacity protein-like surface antigen
MKKLLLALAVFCLAGPSFAQTTMNYGIKAGGNLSFSKIDLGQLSINGDVRPGFYGGTFIQVSPVDPESKFKVQLEALFNQANAQYSETEQKVKLQVNQIEVPLLAQYYILPQLSVNLGPTFNFNLGGKGSIQDTLGNSISQNLTTDDLNLFQIGLAAGLTYYTNSGIFIDARYNPVFGQVNKAEEGDMGTKMRISNVQLGIGFRF